MEAPSGTSSTTKNILIIIPIVALALFGALTISFTSQQEGKISDQEETSLTSDYTWSACTISSTSEIILWETIL